MSLPLVGIALPALAQEAADKVNTNWPGYQEGDYVIKDYKFVSGEALPELKQHYRTIGTAQKNAKGEIVNGVLLLQGNTGTGDNWFRPSFADELFAPGQPLDLLAKYFPSSCSTPSVGASVLSKAVRRAQGAAFRTTATMIWSTRRTGWVTDGLKVAHLRLVIGSSPGCMQQFLWAEWWSRPDGRHRSGCRQPVEISGRNYMLRYGALPRRSATTLIEQRQLRQEPEPLMNMRRSGERPDRKPGAHPGKRRRR